MEHEERPTERDPARPGDDRLEPPPPIDYVARWAATVAARHDQGRRLDPEWGRPDAWGGERARTFARFVTTRRSRPDPVLDRIRPHVDRATTVLEIGPGAGRHTIPLARLVRRVVAVEPSNSMREELASRLAAEAVDNVEVVAAAFPDVDLAPADVAVCAHVIYPVVAIEPFLLRLDALAGRSFVALRLGHREAPIADLFQALWGEPRCPGPTCVDLLNVTLQLGLLASFELVPAPTPWSFDSLDDAVRRVKADLLNPPGPEAEQLIRSRLAERLVRIEDKLTFASEPTFTGIVSWSRSS